MLSPYSLLFQVDNQKLIASTKLKYFVYKNGSVLINGVFAFFFIFLISFTAIYMYVFYLNSGLQNKV